MADLLQPVQPPASIDIPSLLVTTPSDSFNIPLGPVTFTESQCNQLDSPFTI